MAAWPGPPARAADATDVAPLTVVATQRPDVPLLAQPIAETPQTIDVIPADVIRLRALSDLRDVLRLDPSVSAHADEDSGQGDNVQIRGFSARFDLYRDGQLDLGRYYRDPFDLDEVLTGPSSVLFGRGSTGGVINEVGKAPLPAPLDAAEISAGTDGLARVTADVNAPLGSDAAFRINAMAHRSGTAGRDLVDAQRVGVSPVLGLGLNGPTQLTLGWLHQSQWDRPDYGLPWIDIAGSDVSHPAAAPSRDFYGFRDDYSRVSADIATATLRRDLGAGWTFHDQLRFASYRRNFRIVEPTISQVVAPGTPLSAIAVARTVRGGSSREGFLEDEADVAGAFQTFGLRHSLVVSAQIGQQTSNPTTLSFSGVPGANLVTPDESMRFAGVAKVKSVVRFKAETAAASAGDSITLGAWRLDAAVRVDRFAADYHNHLPAPVAFQHTDVAVSYRAALGYALATNARAYIMWGASFDPSAEDLALSASTADLAPERNRTTEAGLKWSPRPALLLSLAAFRTIQVNTREPSPADPTVSILAGTARSEGIEILAQGRISPRWLVQGGYDYLDATIVASPNNDLGRPLQNAPRHNLRLTSAYDATPRLTVGAAVAYQSSRTPSSTPDPNGFVQSVPGYATVSALARYRVSNRVSVALNAENLADARYYDGLDDNHVNIGAGRSVHVTLLVSN